MYFKQNADVRAARESFVDAPTAGCPEEPRALSLRSAPVRHCHWYLNSALQLPLQAVHPWDAKLLGWRRCWMPTAAPAPSPMCWSALTPTALPSCVDSLTRWTPPMETQGWM